MEKNFCRNIIEMYGMILNGEIGGRMHFSDKFNVSIRMISNYINYLQNDLNVVMHYDKKSNRYIIDNPGIFKILNKKDCL